MEQLESFDLGALLLGVLHFFGDKFDPRIMGISVVRKCYFSRSVHPSTSVGVQCYSQPPAQPQSMARTRTQSQSQSQQSYVQVGGHMMSHSRANDTNISYYDHRNNNNNNNNNDSNDVNYNNNNNKNINNNISSIYNNYISNATMSNTSSSSPSNSASSLFGAPVRQHLVMIPTAADRRHSFQANEHAALHSSRDKMRKFSSPSASTSLSASILNSFPTNSILPSVTNRNNSFADHTGFLSYVPYKFDPLFIEDPLNPGNNVGRNCFRVLQVQKSWTDVHRQMSQKLLASARDGVYYSLLDFLVGQLND